MLLGLIHTVRETKQWIAQINFKRFRGPVGNAQNTRSAWAILLKNNKEVLSSKPRSIIFSILCGRNVWVCVCVCVFVCVLCSDLFIYFQIHFIYCQILSTYFNYQINCKMTFYKKHFNLACCLCLTGIKTTFACYFRSRHTVRLSLICGSTCSHFLFILIMVHRLCNNFGLLLRLSKHLQQFVWLLRKAFLSDILSTPELNVQCHYVLESILKHEIQEEIKIILIWKEKKQNLPTQSNIRHVHQ